MKINKRNNVFETNSSSIHAICIDKKQPTYYPPHLSFRFGEFGWENECYNDYYANASYLYQALLGLTSQYGSKDYIGKYDECCEYIREVLAKHNVECDFETGEIDWHSYMGNGYIDHVNQLDEWFDDLMKDDDKLIRFIFSDNSYIVTGNDNDDFGRPDVDEDEDNVEVYWKYN